MRQTEDAFQYSRLYQDFKEIEKSDYHGIIRFFETYRREICDLEFNEYFELLLNYAEALFEIGNYRTFLGVADQAIAITIEHNISFYHGEDVFFNMLFKKAAAHYNLLEYDQAEHILRELVKMDNRNELTIRFLKKCIRHNKPGYLKSTRAVSVFLFLLTAGIIAVELCIIRPFFADKADFVELSRSLIFGLGWVVLIAGDCFHRLRVNTAVNQFIHSERNKKQRRRKEEMPVV